MPVRGIYIAAAITTVVGALLYRSLIRRINRPEDRNFLLLAALLQLPMKGRFGWETLLAIEMPMAFLLIIARLAGYQSQRTALSPHRATFSQEDPCHE